MSLQSESTQGLPFSQPVGRLSAPLRTEVLRVLREAILTFQLQPGQRLVERELIESLDISRTTLREALRELAAEGLVTSLPNRGAVVATPSIREATELYDLRIVLECYMVRQFVENAEDRHIEKLSAVLDELEQVVTNEGDVLQNLRAKDRFYEVLGEGAGNHELQVVLTQIQAKVSLLRATSLGSSPERPEEAVNELRALLSAIYERDTAAAEDACRVHLDHASAAGLAGLQHHTQLTDPA